jgi:uncharacterized protein involved in response to NO
VLLFVASEITAPRTAWSGGAAGLAALVLVARMTGWQSLRTGSDALLWSLHVGYAWVPLGLGCIALADLFGLLPWTSGLHALTAGAFGAMILAVMTRAALGHTGRPLRAPRGIPLAYLLVTLGALVRTIAPVAPGLRPLPRRLLPDPDPAPRGRRPGRMSASAEGARSEAEPSGGRQAGFARR